MTHTELRQKFISYFKDKNHQIVSSSPIIPINDPTLLFTNAGMNQFKDVFLGTDKRDYSRAVSIQKCIRAGGKHNDLDNVGFTTRHHTFFEMLGNFSFGDYFKKEAIQMAWNFLTIELGIPKDKLHVTVFETDDEAAEIWHAEVGVPKDKILRMGEKDNFWRMGETGPCGPCSEIFYDHGPEAAKDPNLAFGLDEDRYVEIWNLVFMQYFEDENKKLNPLPSPSVDTGAGLERLAAVLQGVTDNYETDLFAPTMSICAKAAGVTVEDAFKDPVLKGAFKVLCDHSRSVSLLLSEGVTPGSEGQSYVLRRIMRRALRFAQKISDNDQLFVDVCEATINSMSSVYPDLTVKLLEEVREETKKFLATLQQGSQLLNEAILSAKKKGSQEISGETAFKLYDTFGFPVDLTEVIASEQSFTVDVKSFKEKMAAAKELARNSRKTTQLKKSDQFIAEWTSHIESTQFKGYTNNSVSGVKVIALSDGHQGVEKLSAGEEGLIALNSTPFYAESGGQMGDRGQLFNDGTQVEVLDCQTKNDVNLHTVKVLKGTASLNDSFSAHVHSTTRMNTARNHSATHLLHTALRTVLGNHVSQAGSLVTNEKLRFDFKHKKSMTAEEIKNVEDLVNQNIYADQVVMTKETDYDSAVAEGAIAMFGEKYGDQVRMVKMGDFSVELCGGTHVSQTSQIGLFKIVSEGSVSSGVRRIEAISGQSAFNYLNELAQQAVKVRQVFNLPLSWEKISTGPTPEEGVLKLKQEIQSHKKNLDKAQTQKIDTNGILKESKTINFQGKDIQLCVQQLNIENRKALSEVMDQLRSQPKPVVCVLVGGGKPLPVAVAATKGLDGIHSGNLLKKLAGEFGGKGGGRPDFAQGSLENFDTEKALAICLGELQISNT